MITIELPLLEALEPGVLEVGIGLILLGLFGLWRGWVIYTEPLPRFVVSYRGWSNTLLSLPYGGLFMASMGIISLKPPWPELILGLIAIAWLICGIIFLLGFLIWFPTFLVPRWYRRALKAGITRDDYPALTAFKALPAEQQKEAATRRKSS